VPRHNLSAYCGDATARPSGDGGPGRAIIRDVVGQHGGRVRSGTPSAGPPVPRRAVLRDGAGLAGLVVVATLAGCSNDAPPGASPPRPTPTADDVAVARARASASRLAALAQDLEGSDPQLAGVLGAVVADHRTHLAALGAAPSPSPSGSPPVPRGDVRSLVHAETVAAQEALDDLRVVSPGLAVLLARIAAARATHADLLAAKAGLRIPAALRTSSSAAQAAAPPSPAPLPGAAPPVGSPSDSSSGAGPAADGLSDAAREALAALTAGEHAAVYAYGVVVALVATRARDRARDAWSWHMARRDVLEERLLAAGVEPPPAAPAYHLGTAPSAAAATALAATVEDRLATLAARTVAATSGPDRSDAAEALVAVARRAAAWRGSGLPLPG
jgi:Domain of unknown function (DUF4439)